MNKKDLPATTRPFGRTLGSMFVNTQVKEQDLVSHTQNFTMMMMTIKKMKRKHQSESWVVSTQSPEMPVSIWRAAPGCDVIWILPRVSGRSRETLKSHCLR